MRNMHVIMEMRFEAITMKNGHKRNNVSNSVSICAACINVHFCGYMLHAMFHFTCIGRISTGQKMKRANRSRFQLALIASDLMLLELIREAAAMQYWEQVFAFIELARVRPFDCWFVHVLKCKESAFQFRI